MGRVGDEALLRVEGNVKTFQQPVDRVGVELLLAGVEVMLARKHVRGTPPPA